MDELVPYEDVLTIDHETGTLTNANGVVIAKRAEGSSLGSALRAGFRKYFVEVLDDFYCKGL